MTTTRFPSQSARDQRTRRSAVGVAARFDQEQPPRPSRTRRGLSLLLSAAVAVVVTALPAAAGPSPGDVKGPSCADVVGGKAEYLTLGRAGPTVTATITMADVPCRHMDYTLVVLDADEAGTPVTAATSDGELAKESTLHFSVPVSDADAVVCVYVVTSAGAHVFDRAPDAECIGIRLDHGAGGVGQQFV